MRKKVFELTEFQFPIRVYQTGKRAGALRFTVEYGKQVRKGLTLGDAADELGSSIMHLMSCEGRIDNG